MTHCGTEWLIGVNVATGWFLTIKRFLRTWGFSAVSTGLFHKNVNQCVSLRRGADKSLTRPTSQCRRPESIVSLERGVCSCAELPVFSLQRLKGSMSGDVRDFNNIETRTVIKFFFFLQGKAPKVIHALMVAWQG
jgi:hypothetical protein